MKTFILIHGSWHSSWNWHRVIPILENYGHNAIPLDLPGMGSDKTPIENVSFKSTIDEICKFIDTLEEKVILVGHSKNGIIISQVAEFRSEKIEKLIYLAAYLIPNGKSQSEYSVMDKAGLLKPYVSINNGTSTLNSAIYKEGLYHDCDDYITDLAKILLSKESIESGKALLNLSNENYGKVPKYYIECTEDRAVTPFIQQLMYNETKCEKVFQIHSSHSPFFSKPNELCEIFHDIALNN